MGNNLIVFEKIMILDPYHCLGLKRNPFFAPDSLEIDGDRWLDLGYSVAPLPQQRIFLEIIGQKGSGKTSHLLHWQQQTGGNYFYQKPWFWRELPPYLPQITEDFNRRFITYWDEANRIPIPTLLWVLKQAYHQKMTVVIASHWSLKIFAKIVGFSVKTVKLKPFNLEQLKSWIDRQLIAEKLFDDHEPNLAFSSDQLETIMTVSQGSWRKAATYLHRLTAQQARECYRNLTR
jgi:hypothetical protein